LKTSSDIRYGYNLSTAVDGKSLESAVMSCIGTNAGIAPLSHKDLSIYETSRFSAKPVLQSSLHHWFAIEHWTESCAACDHYQSQEKDVVSEHETIRSWMALALRWSKRPAHVITQRAKAVKAWGVSIDARFEKALFE
jgi:hypothetical protein